MSEKALSCKELSDEELVIYAQRGDDDALETLMLRYRRAVLAAVETCALEAGAARTIASEGREALLLEATLGLMLAVRNYSPAKLQLFGGASGADLSFAEFASECVERRLARLTGSDAESSEFGDNAELALSPQVSELARRKFSPLESDIFDLYVAGQSYQEIAQILQRSVKSVDNALYRIKHKLAQAQREVDSEGALP